MLRAAARDDHLGGLAAPATAQTAQPPARRRRRPLRPLPAPRRRRSSRSRPGPSCRSRCAGNQRLEPETVLSYTSLRIGEPYDQERLDQALRDLYATELFADVVDRRRRHRQPDHPGPRESGHQPHHPRGQPAASRTTRSRRKSGWRRARSSPARAPAPTSPGSSSSIAARAATPPASSRRSSSSTRIASTSCSRSTRGRKSRVRRINIIGNEHFGDGRLIQRNGDPRARLVQYLQLARHLRPRPARLRPAEAAAILPDPGLCRLPRRLGGRRADPRPARLHHHLRGRGRASATSSATSRSKATSATSAPERLRARLPMHTGDWYNAQQVEDTVTQLNELAGLFGYAFADVRPNFNRNRENLTMGVTFRVAETPRVYVERIDISGNTTTRDKVIRREFRLAEGDPFNNVRVRRSRDRIQSLGYFQENLEIEQKPGLGAGPRRPRRRGRGARDRPAAAVGRLFEPRALPRQRRRSSSATSWAAARRCAPRSIIRAIPSRSSSASPSPICSTATSRSASTSSGAT